MCSGPSADGLIMVVYHLLDFGSFDHRVETRRNLRYLNNFRGDFFAWSRRGRG